MKVFKFGGSSVAKADRIKQVKDIVKSHTDQKEKLVVVVSALGGITDQLLNTVGFAEAGKLDFEKSIQIVKKRHIEAASLLLDKKGQKKMETYLDAQLGSLSNLLKGVYLIREASPRIYDRVASMGEALSSYLIALYLDKELGSVEHWDARNLIRTNSDFMAAQVDFRTTNKQLKAAYSHNVNVYVMGGFIASSELGVTTTLGRGGSDYTGAIVAAGLGADELQIWTDVDGVMTADPRKVKRAFSLTAMTYEEALEMSHFGAKVIHPPTIQPVLNKKIPIRIRNTFNPDFPGTLITSKVKDEQAIKGISSIGDIAMVCVQGSGMIGVSGISGRLFSVLARANVNVILITQASSEHSISFAIKPNEVDKAIKAIEEEFQYERKSKLIGKISVQKDLAVVSVIGSGMKHSTGISGKLFKALGDNGINVFAIAQGSSELNISSVIEKKDEHKSISALHQAFFKSDVKTINIFLIGATGLIGKTLLDQMAKQQPYLLDRNKMELRLVGMANTSKMLLDRDGISLNKALDALAKKGTDANLKQFVNSVKGLNLPNAIMVDCTASPKPIAHYIGILKESISIVTPNKIACSGPYKNYLELKETANQFDAHFCYETNVGAGLPVINTMRDLNNSGDQIEKIEAVLSGSVSFIFNNFTSDNNFYDIVKQAREKGYTEPDPREDLSGQDVARKALILAREMGLSLESKNIKVQNILPEACIKAKTVDAFMGKLEENNDYFAKLRDKAAKKGKVLRYIASISAKKTVVSLQEVGPESPFYGLSGSDNMISFTTKRYNERPLVVKGPGAGADVTAAGVFAEIIQVGMNLSEG